MTTAERKTTRQLAWSKFGLSENPVGRHAVMQYKGRQLLGTIQGYWKNELLGCTFLYVDHLNGEPWPIQPAALAVEILIREYD